MSAGNVAVMTSPKADVNWCRFGVCRRVEAREESTRHVEAREEVHRRVEVHGMHEALTQNLWAACEGAWSSGDFEAFTDM